jgi:hypothetical protein
MTSSDPASANESGPSRSVWHSSWTAWWLAVGLILLAVPIAAAAYVGTFSRYLADDFCTLGSLKDLGFLGSQAYWYMHWSGRFAFTFVVNLVEALGPWLVPILPAAHLVGLCLGIALAFRRWLGSSLAGSTGVAASTFGALVVYETIAGTPNLYQSLFWQTGVLTYVTPLVIGSFYAAWILKMSESGKVGPAGLAFSGLAMGVAVGFSETVGSLIVAALAGSLVLVLALLPAGERRSVAAKLVVAGLTGGILGMLVVAAAPGNAVRQGLLTPSSNVTVWLDETTRNAYIFSVKTLKADPLRLLLALVIPFLVTTVGSRSGPESGPRAVSIARPLGFLILSPVLTFGLVMACMAPTQYAMSSYPDGRILITAQFAVASGMAVWGAAAGRWLVAFWPAVARSRPLLVWGAAGVLVIALLGVTSFRSTRAITAALPDTRDFAARSDERAAKVLEARAQGEASLAVASLTHMGGLGEISSDSSNWINVCFAQAYGLKRVTAK